MSNKTSLNLPFGNKRLLAVTAIIVLSLVIILPLASAGGEDPPLRASVVLEGDTCSLSSTTTLFYTQFMVDNRAPWTQTTPIPSRDQIANNFVANKITLTDSQASLSTTLTWTYTLVNGVSTATWTATSGWGWGAARLNPIVLPGEKTVVAYFGWVCGGTDNLGDHHVQVTISGTFQGQPTDLTTEYTYRVTP